MAILARAELEEDYVVPIPFDCTPEETQGNEQIIVAILDIPPDSKKLSEAYAFYGKENCKKLIGKIPPGDQEQTVICVNSNCILEKSRDLTSSPPPMQLSPLWTEDRFGMSAEEALIMGDVSKDMIKSIQVRMRKFRKELQGLNIKIDKRSVDTIQHCEKIIQQARKQMETTRSEARWFTAECVAKFIRQKFKVDAWAETLMEPVVLFCVRKKTSDEQAVIIGSSIEGVMNEIEPDEAARFFSEYVEDASVFPIVMDVSFVDGKRITSKKEYYQSSSGGGGGIS